MKSKTCAGEPNLEIAKTWWADLPYQWTPVGWKNHLFRFNVFYNGMIIAKIYDRYERIKEPGIQLLFTPRVNVNPDALDTWWQNYANKRQVTRDDRLVRQGWNDAAAPVLWSEWPRDGLLLRQEVVAHVAGGREIESGVEPLFAWVRLSVHAVMAGLPRSSDSCGFVIQLNAPDLDQWSMGTAFNNFPRLSPYPRALKINPSVSHRRRGVWLQEPDGLIRLGVAGSPDSRVSFKSGLPDDPGFNGLYVQMRTIPGQYVDMLLPAVPVSPADFKRELALGYDQAMKEANRFWSRKPAAAAVVRVPESPVVQAIERNLQMSEVVAERNPTTGRYAKLLGGLTYTFTYPAADSMHITLGLDGAGYHVEADRYLELFRTTQGTTPPPSAYLKPHPGVLGAPDKLQGWRWLTDHGAVLWAAARHVLLTGDQDFLGRWLAPMVSACDYIRDALGRSEHPGVPGLMPPGRATDFDTQVQAVWVDGWNYKGLTTAVRVLRQANHPRAAEFAALAGAWRVRYQRAFRAAARRLPVWRDAAGKTHRLAPYAFYGDEGHVQLRSCMYLDTGPLFPVFAGLFPASDPLMQSTWQWFREGPPRRMARHDASFGQVPFLDHEMSSFEPGFSWNVFHAWQAGDRRKYLEGLYSLLAGAMSRQTFSGCETREGIKALPYVMSLPWHLIRLAVIDDELDEGDLHLLRLVPQAWVRPDAETVFEKIPTEFGPVTLKWRLSRDGKTLQVTFRPEFRHRPRRICLHVPPLPDPLRVMELNGRKTSIRKAKVFLVSVS